MRKAPLHHRQVQFVNAIGSASVRVFRNGNHWACTFSGRNAGSELYRWLWDHADGADRVELRIGNGPLTVIVP